MGDFDHDTRVERVDEGSYRAALDPDWNIWGPNGGYVATIALRAAGAEAAIARPAAFSCHFLSSAKFGDVDLQVTLLRRGRRSESLRVSMSQQGRPILEALLRTAAEGPGLEHDFAEVPKVADPETLRSVEELTPESYQRHSFWKNLEARPLHPERFADDERKPHPPAFEEWFRYRPTPTFDDIWVDAGRSLLLIDTLSWPAACQPHPNSRFIAPNVDVSVWFHRFEPRSEWLLAGHSCAVAQGGLMGTHGKVWGETGELLATGGAQLLCVPAPADLQG